MNVTRESIELLTRLIEQGQKPNLVEDDATPFVIMPSDHVIAQVENTLLHPCRKRGCPSFSRFTSFIEYVNQQKEEETRLYVTGDTQIVAVIDHHRESGEEAGWGQHRANLVLSVRPEWNTWSGANCRKFGQREFAQFIEDNAEEVLNPSGADLVDLIRTIKASQNLEVLGTIEDRGNEASGFVLQTRTKAGAKAELELPSEFTLSIGVYNGSTSTPLQARLRFEITSNGKLQLWYELVRVARFQTKEIESIVKEIKAATELPVWYGTPTPP